MSTYDQDVTTVLTSVGWIGATVANLSTSNDVRATDGDKNEIITAEVTDTPGDFDTSNDVTFSIEWRTDALGASRVKSFLVELVDATEVTVFASFTTPTSSGHTTDRTDTSTAQTISRTAAELDGARFRITSLEGGGMADGIKTEIDRVWAVVDYNPTGGAPEYPVELMRTRQKVANRMAL